MRKILFLLLFCLTFASAEINEYLSDVYFANGIDTSEDDAKLSIKDINDSIKTNYPEAYKYVDNWNVSYNHTHGIGIDLYESMLQKIYEDSPGKSFLPFLWNFDEVFGHLKITFKQIVERISKKVPKNAVKEYASAAAKTIAKETVQYFNKKYAKNFTEEQLELMFNNIFDHIIEESIGSFIDVSEEEIKSQESADVNTHFLKYTQSIKDGHGVIIIAHSQGNLFTNRVYNEFGIFNNIRNDVWMKQYISAIGIASPANNILGKETPYITFDNDMIKIVPDSLPAIEPNPQRYYLDDAIEINGTKIDNKFSVKAHAFLTSYMENNTTRGKILGFVNDKVVEQRGNFSTRPSQWEPKNIGCSCKDKYAKMTHKFAPDDMNQYLADDKVKDFAQGMTAKVYKADAGDHAEYVRAKDGDRSIDGVFTIEEINENGACYALKDDSSNLIGRIEGPTEPILQPKSGVVQVTLTWENPAIDFDLNVGWTAGNHDIQDTGCPMEHFYVESEYDIYPGTYPISVTHKQLDENESSFIPEKMQMIIQVPGKTEVYDIDINTTQELEVGHVADIFVKYIDNVIVPDISPDPVLTPVISIPTSSGSGGGGSGGSGGGGSSSGGSTTWVPIDNPSCNQSCGCIPCEYKIIPYLEQLLYGPISGADIALYEAKDHQNKSPLYVGKTSTGDTLYTAGNIEIPDSIVNSLQDDTLYLLIARGGNDIDHNDDFEIDDISTGNQGETHLLLSGKDIKEIGFKMNVLTEIAYQVTKDIIDVNTTQEVQNKLTEVAQRLLKDKVYGDTAGGINYKDLSFWMPTIHKPLLMKEYNDHFVSLVDNLFANRDIYQDAYAIVYDHISAVPTLQSIRLDINEDINSSIVIGNVPVLNKGTSEITSFILEGDGSENFVIDANGEISISQITHLDYESKTYYQLYVSAVNDDGVSQKVLLLIQLHNVVDAPEYQSFTAFTFYENSEPGTEVIRLLYNVGNSPLQSVQLTGKDSTYFRADIDGNNISIKVNQTLLSYIAKKGYELQLQVSNLTDASQSLPFTLIVSDRRDIPKLGDEWNLRVDENATAGTVVGKVKVISDGYSPIQYFKIVARNDQQNLLHEWPDGYFEIDKNGTISVGENASLDYETKRDYSAYVVAVNAIGESQKGYVRVNVNNIPDTPPSIRDTTPLNIRVNKEAQPGTLLGTFTFYYGDNPITSIELSPTSPFEAVPYNPYNYSSVNTGAIKLKDSLRDTQVYEYDLTAVVRNSAGDSNEKPIHITVNQESYEFSVLEGTYNTVIGEIDFGTEAVKSVTLPNDDSNLIRNHFTLDNNGTLSTKPDVKWAKVLNYLDNPQLSFTASVVYENGTSKNIGITINVLSRTIATVNTPGVAKQVVVNQFGDRAYVADYDRGLHIIDISDITNPQIIASLDTNGAANDLVLSKSEQYIYLLDVGKGLKVIDISNEASPDVVSEVALSGYSFNVALSSDESLAFVSHGTSGIEVIDIVDPISPTIIQNIGFLGTIENGGFNTSYNDVQAGGYQDIVLDGNRLYSVDWNYGLQVIDISDLINPLVIYSESLKGVGWGHSATAVHLHKEQKLVSVTSVNDEPMSLYSIKDSGKVDKIRLDYTYDEIEVFDNDIAYRTNSAMIGYDAYNPTSMTRLLYLGLGQSYGMVLDKQRDIAYLANGKNGLRLINLSGIKQPVHHEPVLGGIEFNIPEQNLSLITIDDVLGSVPILKTGDTPILQMRTAQSINTSGSPDCGYTYYALSKDKMCEYDYSFFDVDANGNIHINDINSLAYENIGNMVPFSVYAVNENGHESQQAKVMINIQEYPEYTIKFQRNVIKVDQNTSRDTPIANVIYKESQRELVVFGVYRTDDYYCNQNSVVSSLKQVGNYNKSIAQIIESSCTVSTQFSIDSEGNLYLNEALAPGIYTIHIIAADRFGSRWLANQEIEILQ